MQTQQLCQRNFESRWTRDHCETFNACLLLHFIHIPVGPGINWHYMNKWIQVQLASPQQWVGKQAPEMCWLLLIPFSWYNPLGRRERGRHHHVDTPCAVYRLANNILAQFFSYLSQLKCISAALRHNKPITNCLITLHMLRWNNESL